MQGLRGQRQYVPAYNAGSPQAAPPIVGRSAVSPPPAGGNFATGGFTRHCLPVHNANSRAKPITFAATPGSNRNTEPMGVLQSRSDSITVLNGDYRNLSARHSSSELSYCCLRARFLNRKRRGMRKALAINTAAIVLVLAFTSLSTAQEITGVPGSPSATLPSAENRFPARP